MTHKLATISAPAAPAGQAVAAGHFPAPPLSGRQKAALIVRLLLAEGAPLPLGRLPEDIQAALTAQIATMRPVDHGTVQAVATELAAMLENTGLSFPGGLEGALSLLDGHISSGAANRLRRMAGQTHGADPWQRIASLDTDHLLPLLEAESPEVAAVLVSMLPVTKAAGLLGRLPGARARRVAYAISRTGAVAPETVQRIGYALVSQLDAQTVSSFDSAPEQRVGAILNSAPSATREDILKGLEETDTDFAAGVRKAIFIFADIPQRVAPRDVPRIIRKVESSVLVNALTNAQGAEAEAAAFILANISPRLADSLREEIASTDPVPPQIAEESQTALITAIRNMEATGELVLNTGA